MAQYRLVLSAGGHDEADNALSMWQGAKLAMKDWVGVHCALNTTYTKLTTVHLALHAPPLLVDLGTIVQGLLADHREFTDGLIPCDRDWC
jgi:hypothetical protein